MCNIIIITSGGNRDFNGNSYCKSYGKISIDTGEVSTSRGIFGSKIGVVLASVVKIGRGEQVRVPF